MEDGALGQGRSLKICTPKGKLNTDILEGNEGYTDSKNQEYSLDL